ncbi:MAG: site-specific DNA-methyltransferase [Pseudomonadota bacterium]
MSNRKQRLELTWIGKGDRPRLEPRILLEDADKSYHAKARVSDRDIFDNILIHGDNLLALKALEQEFDGRVQAIYIDPPFNTGEAFDNYDDGIEHSLWLDLMHKRLSVLHRLLHESGTAFIHIDDNEIGYLIALTDEIFGRGNRISVVTFKQSSVSGPKARNPGVVSIANYVLIYAKNKSAWKHRNVYRSIERDDRYAKFIENVEAPHREWRFVSLKDAFCRFHGVKEKELDCKFGSRLETHLEKFVLEHSDKVVRTARVADQDVNEDARDALRKSREEPNVVQHSARESLDDFYFINGEQIAFYRNKAREIDGEYVTAERISNLWDDLLSNNLHKEGGVSFKKGKKPEALIKRCLELSTSPGDLVLDSFLGSGTTAAVAHKMRRRWIGIELGDHALTHVIPRMRSVIDGGDASGITTAVEWKGGGGFRYYRLAPSLLEKDAWGNWVISKDYDPARVAQAVCKLMGFVYQPDETHYWMQGRSSEADFIYVTTQSLAHEQLVALSEEVGEERTLLVCCKAFRADPDAFPNLTIKKIPQAVLRKCEWGKDDYSFKVANLPEASRESDDPGDPEPTSSAGKKRGNGMAASQDDLFFSQGGGK